MVATFQPGHAEVFGLQPQFKAHLTVSARPGKDQGSGGRRFAPLVAANDPLPAEIIAAANLICHASGDLLMRSSSLCGAMHRPVAFDRLTHALDLIEQEAAARANASKRIGETIRALQARAGS